MLPLKQNQKSVINYIKRKDGNVLSNISKIFIYLLIDQFYFHSILSTFKNTYGLDYFGEDEEGN